MGKGDQFRVTEVTSAVNARARSLVLSCLNERFHDEGKGRCFRGVLNRPITVDTSYREYDLPLPLAYSSSFVFDIYCTSLTSVNIRMSYEVSSLTGNLSIFTNLKATIQRAQITKLDLFLLWRSQWANEACERK